MRFLKNDIFQRVVYFLLMLGWSLLLLPSAVSQPFTETRRGISYGSLYFPVAALLLFQVFLNDRLLWFTWLLVFIAFGIYILYDQSRFHAEYHTKTGQSTQGFIAELAVSFVILLLSFAGFYQMKPSAGK